MLRAITPQNTCRNLNIFPVKLTQEAISVDVSGVTQVAAPSGKGGADTSIDANNVFGVESRPYYEAENPISANSSSNPAEAFVPVLKVNLG